MSELDKAVIVIGPPKHGKTTIVRELVRDHLQRYETGIALIHDTNRQFPDFCARYESAGEYRAALVKAGKEKTPLARGASIGGDAAPVAELAAEIGRQHNTSNNVRIPILLAYDETSMMETSGSSWIAKVDLQINANRRHWGIAPVYNVQRPTALTEAFYTMATDVIVFSQPSGRRTGTLEEYLGLREHTLDVLVGGPKYKHVRWKQGEGLV